MTINIVLCSIPNAKASCTTNADGTYTVLVSNQLSREQAKTEILHEIDHIRNDDFGKAAEASLIEEMIRRSDIIPATMAEDMEFFYHVV